jgi:predicted site-specific integrase-resolvase
VIYGFSAKLYGLKEAKEKTEKIVKEILYETEND